MNPEVPGSNNAITSFDWANYKTPAQEFNEQAMKDTKPASIFASLDTNKNSSVENNEAKSKIDAGFKDSTQTIKNNILSKYADAVKNAASSSLPKESLQNLYNKFASTFKSISYKAGETYDTKNKGAQIQQQIDGEINSNIESQITGFNEQANNAYTKLITDAMEAAKAEIEKESGPKEKVETGETPETKERTPLTGGDYKVVKGDNLTKIAKRYGTTPQEIAKLNGMNLNDIIYPGDLLKIPDTTSDGETIPEVGDKSKMKKPELNLENLSTSIPDRIEPLQDLQPRINANITRSALEAQDAKFLEREVNGKPQEIAVYNNSEGEKVRQVINDDGSLENLVAISTDGKNKYITQTEANKELAKLFGSDVANVLIKKGATPVYQDGKIAAVKVEGQTLTGTALNSYIREQMAPPVNNTEAAPATPNPADSNNELPPTTPNPTDNTIVRTSSESITVGGGDKGKSRTISVRLQSRFSEDGKTPISSQFVNKDFGPVKMVSQNNYENGQLSNIETELSQYDDNKLPHISEPKGFMLVRMMKRITTAEGSNISSSEVRNKEGEVILSFKDGQFFDSKGNAIDEDNAKKLLEKADKKGELEKFIQNMA